MKKKDEQNKKSNHDIFECGPIRIERFGKNFTCSSNLSQNDIITLQKINTQRYPKIVQEIDNIVAKISSIVIQLPPDKLLYRAWWEMAQRYIHVTSESEIETDDSISLRMIDYIQSIIASVPPSEEKKTDVNEEDWALLKESVKKLFLILNFDYQICRTAKNKSDNLNYCDSIEEFEYKAQLYWCNVRGHRYQAHHSSYLYDVLLPHTKIIKEIFGITSKQFVEEIMKIWRSLTYGLEELFGSLFHFKEDVNKTIKEYCLHNNCSSETVDMEILAKVIKDNHWENSNEDIIGGLHMDIFDIQKLTNLPQKLLNELTWSPGEESEFFARGEFRGWPLRVWPIFKRPFLKLNNRYYCFDLHSLFDNIYRIMQKIILRYNSNYKEEWNNIQKTLIEELSVKYLKKILPKANIFASVYYEWYPNDAIKNKQWCETDALLLYDDHLFIIESKGGAFTYTPPATDFPAYIDSLKNLILKPATQGRRFFEYFNNQEEVTIYNSEYIEIIKLNRKNFRKIIICTVTLDPFTELAAQVQNLRKIGIDVDHPIWSLSLDDLRVYADVFDNSLIFLHYLEQRMQEFYSNSINIDDELVHLGLYLKHNHYNKYAKEMKNDSITNITFSSYKSEIDNFFYERLRNPIFPCPLKQAIPKRIFEIIEHLPNSNTSGYSRISEYLLDFDDLWREKFSNAINQELKNQLKNNRVNPISLYGNINCTIFCYMQPKFQRDAEQSLFHTYAVMSLRKNEDMILLELTYNEDKTLKKVDWSSVKIADIPYNKIKEIKIYAENLRKKRILSAKNQQDKLKRNSTCPCGSGVKYKKCCLNLTLDSSRWKN